MANNEMDKLKIRTAYKDSILDQCAKPFWERGQFLRNFETLERVSGLIELSAMDENDFVDQNTNTNFEEFENQEVINLTGYSAEVMRAHGCGISSVYMAIRALLRDDFPSEINTVGMMAIRALSNHRNDFIGPKGERVVGTPVFNLKSGWYHDALVYVGLELANLDSFRCEKLPGLASVGEICAKSIREFGRGIITVISVDNKHWRLRSEKSSVSTHMVAVNGFRFLENGKLDEIRVADSYVSTKPKINEWIKVTDDVELAFTGKAIFFQK